VLGILGPACIALALGVAPSGPRPDAALSFSTNAPTVAREQVAPEDAPADCFLANEDAAAATVTSQSALGQYAQLELGEALLAKRRFREAEEHLRAFIASHPTSPRLAKAHSSLALALRQQNRAHEALALYRATIERLGDDPANRSVQTILLACARLHREPADRIALQHELSTLASRARTAGRRTLAARCAWLLARIAKRSHPESTHQTFVGLARDVPPYLLPPAIAIEIADHLVASDHRPDAEPLLRHLACRDGTPECPRALAALALIAAERGDCGEALAIYEVFEQQSARSALLPRILESHAEILVGQARHAEAIAILERLLGLQKLKDATAARALCRVGEAHEALGQPEKAMPFYQRVHTLYAGCADPVAHAYIASGRIFEKLKLWDSARRTYEELLSRDDLAAREECALARERLQAIP
jgi:tetratricopeptide (TPR) repeat protein